MGALVGSVQAEVADAESRGGGDAEVCQVVADVGRGGDLGLHLEADCLGGVEEGDAQPKVFGECVGGPAGVTLDERRPGSGPGVVDSGNEVFEQAGGGFVVEGGRGADINVEGAQVRGDRVAVAARDGGDGELARQREIGAGPVRKFGGGKNADQVGQ